MKKTLYYIIALFVSVLFSCRTQSIVNDNSSDISIKQKNFEEFSSTRTEYRVFPATVKFFDPTTDPNPSIVVNDKMKFIKSSGLPDESNLWEWKQSHSIKEAINLYTDYIAHNVKADFISIFKQYGAWLILTKLDLLSENSSEALNEIYFLIKSLIQTNYEGFQLIDYTFKYLLKNSYSNKKDIKELGNQVLEYSKVNLKNKGQKPNIVIQMPTTQSNGKPYPPGVIESLKRNIESTYSKNFDAISSIQETIDKI